MTRRRRRKDRGKGANGQTERIQNKLQYSRLLLHTRTLGVGGAASSHASSDRPFTLDAVIHGHVSVAIGVPRSSSSSSSSSSRPRRVAFSRRHQHATDASTRNRSTNDPMIAVTASMSPSSAGEGGGVGGGSGDGGGGGDGGGDGDAHVGGGDDDDDGGEFAIHALGGPFVAADELASELPVHIDASGDPAVYPQFVNAVVHAVASLNITNAVVRAPSSHPVTSALKSVAPLNMYAMFVTAAVFHPDMF